MKRTICLVFFGILSQCLFAQSIELKDSYKQVTSTLKDYKLQSEDVHKCNYDMYETKTITLKLSDGNLIFTFTDQFVDWGMSTAAHPGTKTITVPINEAIIKTSDNYDKYIFISGVNGVEYKLKNKKELITGYRFYSTELTIKKLYNELTNLLEYAKSENFNGNLGAKNTTTAKPKSSNSTPQKKSDLNTNTDANAKTTQQNKKAGKYIQ